jgi:glycerophosphoryl diester phosphodiesterase
VFFITNAGKPPLSDKEKRAGSLQNAARFAKQWGLAGIVVAADSLVMCPRLIDVVRFQGLVCGSYNGLNNEPANVKVRLSPRLTPYKTLGLIYHVSYKSRQALILSWRIVSGSYLRL